MKDYRYYLNENADNFNDTLEGLIMSLGYSKFEGKAVKGQSGYLVDSSSKRDTFVIYDNDRMSTRTNIENVLKSNKIKHETRTFSSSSFDGLYLKNKKEVVFLFKPVMGQGGSGSGALNTSIQETSQAVFLSLSFNVLSSTISENDVNESNLQKAYSLVNSNDIPLGNILEMCEDKEWLNTFIQTTNVIFKDYYKSGNKYTFERGSKLVNKIYSDYRSLSKELGISAKDDKWNPADIWIVTDNLLVPNNIGTLSELNDFIKNAFTNKDLIGVSLKKIKGKPKVSIYNIQNIENDFKFDKYIFSDKSKDLYLETKGGNGKIQFRTSNNMTGYQGEIIGKTAKHGKIGYEMLNYFLNRYGASTLPKAQKDVSGLFKNDDESILNEYIQLWNKYTSVKLENVNSAVDYSKGISNNYKDFMFSNYISMKIIETLDNMTPEGKDKFMNGIMSYAKSSSDFSSIFIKVE